MVCEVWEGMWSGPQCADGVIADSCSATLDLAYVAMGSLDIWWEGGCWEWYVAILRLSGHDANINRDVAAGFAILEEAGGLVTTANPPSDPETADITRAHLGGRLYLAIR